MQHVEEQSSRTNRILWGLAVVVVVITLGLQSYNVGFANGHHGWVSAHGLAIFRHLSIESGFVGHALQYTNADGTHDYGYFDRYPLFFSAVMRPFFAITDNLNHEIYIYRQLMNVVFLLTMAAAYRVVTDFISDRVLAFAITVMACSSYYLLYYKDQMHFDQPALLGMLLLIGTITRYRRGDVSRRWLVIITLAAVVMGRGYASFFVLGLWFLVTATETLIAPGLTIREKITRLLRHESIWLTVIALVWASFWLGYNLYVETHMRGISLMETSIFNSARRRIPFLSETLAASDEPGGYGPLAWGLFGLVQAQRVVLWFMPLKLGGTMEWRYFPLESELEFSLYRVIGVIVLLVLVIWFVIRQRGPDRGSVVIAAFGGALWTFFMINLSAEHIYVTMYTLGFVLVAHMALWGGLVKWRGAQWGLVIISVLTFAGSNALVRDELTREVAPMRPFTDDYNRIQAAISGHGRTVYLAFGGNRYWCVIDGGQCFAVGYYLGDHYITEHYAPADYVLSPRTYHVSPPLAEPGAPVDLLSRSLVPQNVTTHLFDKAAVQQRTAPADDVETLFRFGEPFEMVGWSLDGDVNIRPCESVVIESWWRANAQPDLNVNMQVVMVDRNGAEVSASNYPLGLLPTAVWVPGQYVLEARPVTVPCDTPPGEYPLIAGVYVPDTTAPLPAYDVNGNAVGNQIYLTTLFVQQP